MRKSVRVLSLVPVIALAVWSTPPAGGSQRTDSSRPVEDKDPEAEDRILTPSEAELAHWLEVNGDTQVQSAAQALPDLELALGRPGFGGMRWESPGKLHVMVVGDENSTAQATVKAWATAIPNTEVTTSYVRHAYSDLEAVVAEMPGVVEQLAGRGQLESAAVQVEDNVVEVAVLESSADAVKAALAKRYGTAVRVVTAKELSEPADRRDDSTPFYGGVALWTVSTSNPYTADAYCTMGFTWRLWTTNQIVGSTAGHCRARGQTWWNATSPVGTVTHRAWADGPTTPSSSHHRLVQVSTDGCGWAGSRPELVGQLWGLLKKPRHGSAVRSSSAARMEARHGGSSPPSTP